MSVGIVPGSSQIDTNLTILANSLRKVMEQLNDYAKQINGMGQSGLETAGYDADDAAAALLIISYFSTIVGVYYGTVQQGGSGGDGAITFDFDNAMSQLWGGQVQ